MSVGKGLRINASTNIENYQDNIVQLDVVKRSKRKLKTDGIEKKTPNNNSVNRWVYPIREKPDVKRCIDYLHEKEHYWQPG